MKKALADPLFHWVVAAAIILGIWVAASSPSRAGDWGRAGTYRVPMVERYVTHDRWGNAYPPACQQNLEDIPAQIHYLDLEALWGKLPLGRRRLGGWDPPRKLGEPHNIYINIKLPESRDPQIVREIIHHERCHALWYMKYGHPDWHGRDESD